MRLFWSVVLLVAICCSCTSCYHSLKVRNLSDYYLEHPPEPLSKKLSMGMVSRGGTYEAERYAESLADALRSSGSFSRVVFPCNPGEKVDCAVSLGTSVENSGSFWNFFPISFPGFLLWTPAWNGFVYEQKIAFNVRLTGADGKFLESLDESMVFNLRHADMDRTWVEFGWFGYGIPAFVGGIFNTSYDPDVSAEITVVAGKTVGKFLAAKVITMLGSHEFLGRGEPTWKRDAAE